MSTPIEVDRFANYLGVDPSSVGWMTRRRLDDGRILTLYPELLGTYKLLIDDNLAMHTIADRHGEDTETDGGADFYYQYDSLVTALIAFNDMEEWHDEPNGWIRAAPPRFRRRPGGDPALEFVRE